MLFDLSRTPPGAPRGQFLSVEQPQKVGVKKYAGPKKAYFLTRPVCLRNARALNTPETEYLLEVQGSSTTQILDIEIG